MLVEVAVLVNQPSHVARELERECARPRREAGDGQDEVFAEALRQSRRCDAEPRVRRDGVQLACQPPVALRRLAHERALE